MGECIHCCDPTTNTCLSCSHPACQRCVFNCSTCPKHVCVECVDTCDNCERAICNACVLQLNVCKCCERSFDAANTGSFCVDCVMTHWFDDDKTDGFICAACSETCHGNTCKVKSILDAQTNCPICFDPFDKKPYSLQHCELHKICNKCDYNPNNGCPICREGSRSSGSSTTF